MDYAELLSAIESWTGDTFDANQRKQFVALAEAEFNRRLRTLDMEARAVATLSGDYLALPDDFLKLRAIQIGNILLEPVTPQFIRERKAWSGEPRYYAITDGQIQFFPVPNDDYDVEIIYFRTIPVLSDTNTTNWLIESHPDLYLFRSLAFAETFGWNDTRAAGFGVAAQAIMEQISEQEKSRRVGAQPVRMSRPLNAPRN